MIILGLTVLWHDITAALLIDGKIAGIIEEERLSRQKHHRGTFDPISIPWLSIKNLLENNSLKIEDIDYIAINYSPSEALLWRAKSHNIIVNFIWNLFKNLHIKYDVKKNFKNKIIFVPHHIAHASSAIFGSGFKECAFISCDGGGENKSIYLGEFKKGEINVIETYSNYYSIGFLYEFIADYLLNLGIGEGSGKMMGLSSYGNPDTFKDVFDKIIKIDDSQFIVKKDLNFPGSNELSNFLRKHFKFRKKEEKIINNYYEHIAATVQSIIEDVLIFLIKKLLKKTKQKKLVFAGGVGLNSKANFKILKKLKLKENDFYIFPQANDAGGAIGSAYYVYYSITKKFPQPIQHTYWGTEYDNNYIYKLLKKNKLKYKTLEYDNLFNYIANKLCEGKNRGMVPG